MTPPKQADPAWLPTLADLDALPPGIVGEIIEGVLYTMTKPRMAHQLLGLELGSDLLGPFGKGRGGPGGWWIGTEPGIERPDHTLEISPDVGGWRRERMPKAPRKRAIRVVPDWVCEILSPSTRHHDLVDKMPYYAKIGVPYAWLVDLERGGTVLCAGRRGRPGGPAPALVLAVCLSWTSRPRMKEFPNYLKTRGPLLTASRWQRIHTYVQWMGTSLVPSVPRNVSDGKMRPCCL